VGQLGRGGVNMGNIDVKMVIVASKRRIVVLIRNIWGQLGTDVVIRRLLCQKWRLWCQ